MADGLDSAAMRKRLAALEAQGEEARRTIHELGKGSRSCFTLPLGPPQD